MSSVGRIPQEVLDDIASRLDIVDVVGRYVPLTRRGANYMGLCPFHAEKTPSFSVSPDKQIFHCFGCGVGGNIYRFLMDIEGLSFPEAARKLAREAGVTIPDNQRTPAQIQAEAKKKRYYQVMELAEKFFIHQWHEEDSQIFKDYVRERGLKAETIETYGIGATASGWDGLVSFLSRCKVPFEDMEALGLGFRSRKGNRVYDRFRQRLIFPIRDASGRTIGFGGRIVGESDQPQKYLNSPETPLFHKGEALYGLDLARVAIRRQNQVVVTEGYMDVLACHQIGVKNAVAPMGTALTPEQVKSLMRHTYDFTLAFDGDEAGRRAALKALDIIENLGGRAKVLLFVGDSDPDTFIQKEGADAFHEALAQAMDGIDFRLIQATSGRNLETVSDKMLVLDELMEHLLGIRQRARLEMTIDKVAEALKLSRQAIQDEIRYGRRHGSGPPLSQTRAQLMEPPADKVNSLSSQDQREGLFLSLLFADSSRFAQAEEAGGERLFSGMFKKIYQQALKQYQAKGSLSAADMPAEWSHLLSKYLTMDEEERDNMRSDYFDHTLAHMGWQAANRRYQELLQKLDDPTLSSETAAAAMEELSQLIEEKTRFERLMRKEQ